MTSLGESPSQPSRNRTVLAGLIRDLSNPMATRFELRAPNPKSNTYLVLASSWMACIDGVKACLDAEKTPKELERSISKKYGKSDFYLEKDREYRSEKQIFEDFTPEERTKLFGKTPATVWENIEAFSKYPEKLAVLKEGGVMTDLDLESYKENFISEWKTELHDTKLWNEIEKLRHEIGKETLRRKSLLMQIKEALDAGDYSRASDLQIIVKEKISELSDLYAKYKKNIM